MGPDPSLLLTCRKKEANPPLTWVLFDPTQGEKIEKFDIFSRNFPISNPNHKWLTLPGSKNFDPNPSLGETSLCLKDIL